MSRYVIPDIHGCARTLDALLNALGLTSDDEVFFLGDYIDRGPDSRDVMDTVMSLPQARPIRGNHDELMLRTYDLPQGDPMRKYWAGRCGGWATINSFAQCCMDRYLGWIADQPLYRTTEGYFLVHGGIDHNDPWNSSEEHLLWDRTCVVGPGTLDGATLIHGHTTMTLQEIRMSCNPLYRKHYKIGLDNGCVFAGMGDHRYGSLVALHLDEMRLLAVPNKDIRKL